jgi:hypothetical protein
VIVLLEEPETWSLLMLVSAVAIDNTDLSPEGKEAIRKWRSEQREGTAGLQALTDELNTAMNSHLDAKFLRRVQLGGGRSATVKK